MFDCYAGMAMALHGLAEVNRDARMIREAKTPAEAAAVFAVIRERDERRHQLAVAKASAPQVTVVNRIYNG